MTRHVPLLARILRPASFAPLALVLGVLAACDDATTDPLARIVAGETAGALAPGGDLPPPGPWAVPGGLYACGPPARGSAGRGGVAR